MTCYHSSDHIQVNLNENLFVIEKRKFFLSSDIAYQTKNQTETLDTLSNFSSFMKFVVSFQRNSNKKFISKK